MQIKSLYENAAALRSFLPPELERLYDGRLSFPEAEGDRPLVIGNFVTSLDGVASFSIPGESGGGPLSGFNDEDHFVMGLLRSAADAVLVGSGTLHGDPGQIRIAEAIYPKAASVYAELRAQLGKPPRPINVILTASGKLDLEEPTFHTPGLDAVVITTMEGASRLSSRDLSNVTVYSTGESGQTTPQAVLRILSRELGVRVLLHEGGPTAFGQFLSERCVDEFFLTLSPQIAGRDAETCRPSFAGSALFLPETAPWMKLMSAKLAGDHLLLRYATQ